MKSQRNVLLLIVILLLIFGFGMMDRSIKLSTELSISEQNNKALNDSIRLSKNKVGEVVASKNVLVAEKEDLIKLNTTLGVELSKEKGKVSELNVVIAELKSATPQKPITIVNTIIKREEGVYGLSWDYDTTYNDSNSRIISGISEFRLDTTLGIIPLNTTINKDIIRFKLVTGLKEHNGNIEIFAKSNYPGFEILQLDGAIIDPKKHPVIKKFTKPKKWGVGPYIGFGFSNSLLPTVQIGVGLQYSLIKF